MTESEWLSATDPAPMLPLLKGRASARKLRLFMLGWCRRGWDHFGIPTVRDVFETVERYADGDAGEEAVAALRTRYRTRGLWAIPVGPLLAEAGRMDSAAKEFLVAAENASPPHPSDPVSRSEWARSERAARAALLRDVVGNSFRPVETAPSWLTSDVLALARGIYEDRAFERLPILADALQDAGCTDETVLGHCREEKQFHCRGCRERVSRDPSRFPAVGQYSGQFSGVVLPSTGARMRSPRVRAVRYPGTEPMRRTARNQGDW